MSTPARQQYLRIKQQYPDAILFFRLGDFYETFDEDAKIVSSELDIVLTSREVRGKKIPMAGVPYHAAEGYIAKLIANGHKVAICDQIGEPDGKNLVERKVTRVLTPGTVDHPSLIEAQRNNYLMAVCFSRGRVGLAFADVSTGDFYATEITGEDRLDKLRDEITRIQPSEVLVSEGPDKVHASEEHVWMTQSGYPGQITVLESWKWKTDAARDSLLSLTDAQSLEAFGLDSMPVALKAAGALVQYISDTNPAALSTMRPPSTYFLSNFMPLDDRTRRNLELIESTRGDKSLSLLAVLDHTSTAMGARMLRNWINQPLISKDSIENRLNRVQEFVAHSEAREKIRETLKQVSDLERLANRLVQKTITPRELRSLALSLEKIPELVQVLQQCNMQLQVSAHNFQHIVDLILSALVDDPPAVRGGGTIIREGYSQELDRLRSASTNAKQWIASLERKEREATGIKNLRVGYNKVFGYYIEVTNSFKHLVPDRYIRKQTLVGAERFITPELKEYESLILNSQTEAEAIEEQLLDELITRIAGEAGKIFSTARQIAEIDCYISLAEAAVRHQYVRPIVSEDDVIEIKGGRHPVVELRASEGFVPNDAFLDQETHQVLILTGPNMAGKSTYLRQVALITLMAQIGSFVPADSARIGIVDRIFTRVGAQDDIASGQSTFMVEMTETAYILAHCTPKSLVILDEIGRGTSTYDGMAIAQAVVEYLHNNTRARARTLFATHYHELTSLEEFLPRVKNFRMEVLEEGNDVVFLRKVVPGGADKSYGIHVAKLAGIPKSVIRRAQELLKELEAQLKQEEEDNNPQLTFLNPDDGLLQELADLDVESMTPVEALTKLFEIRQRAATKLLDLSNP